MPCPCVHPSLEECRQLAHLRETAGVDGAVEVAGVVNTP